ncbi:MAG: hypothetical protein K0U98_18025 [Deltaproteobacteria bacterium]|nr:hypothetical protein [Deltaproteobacteria bacterium]
MVDGSFDPSRESHEEAVFVEESPPVPPAEEDPGSKEPSPLDRRRYRKVRRYFLRVSLHVFFWDILLNRPGLRGLRRAPLPRWIRLAEDFRELAVEMGGVLIKLGQYLRTRVDVLPVDVAAAFAGLQDSVPPEPFEDIKARVEGDFGRPVGQVFHWIDSSALGSASLGQVHRAQLLSGEEVAVKVLRPGIRKTVETDLVLIGRFVKRLKFFKRVRQQADLDWLTSEFAKVTRQELDMVAEGRNSERFAEDFADDPQVYVPKIYWDYCRANTLVMENVGYFRVDDLATLEAAGVGRDGIARKIANVYLRQFFRTSYVHADPHEGNLFVRPLPFAGELDEAGQPRISFAPGELVPSCEKRSFQLIFIDFGMMISIPKRLRPSLRQYAIGVGTRDSRKIVEAYVASGLLAPGADLNRIEEMTEGLLQRFEGTLLGQMKGVDLDEYVSFFADEYSDLLFNNPFRIPGDMLFVFRAMGILSGVIAKMEADLDLSVETVPLAQDLLQEEGQDQLEKTLLGLRDLAFNGYRTFERLDSVLTKAAGGRLVVRTLPSAEEDRDRRNLRRSVRRLGWVAASFGLLVSGSVWRLGDILLTGSRGEINASGAGTWLVAAGVASLILGIFRGR